MLVYLTRPPFEISVNVKLSLIVYEMYVHVFLLHLYNIIQELYIYLQILTHIYYIVITNVNEVQVLYVYNN